MTRNLSLKIIVHLDGGVGEETEGAEGVCSPMEGATVSTGQIILSSPGQDHQPRIHMERPMALATCVAEDGLDGQS